MPKVLESYFRIIDHHIRWTWLAAAISLSHNLTPDMFIFHIRRRAPSSPCGSCGLTASLKWTVGRVRPAEQSQADCWLLTVSRSAPCRHSVPAALRPGGAHPLCGRVLSSMFVCCLAFSFAFVWKPAVTRSLGRGSAVHVRVVSVNANVWKSVSGSPGPSFALIVVWRGNGGHKVFYNITAMICAHKQGF